MAKQQELSYDTKLVLTLVFLFILYPVGLILMFKWMDWPKWLKIVLSLPVIIFMFLIVAGSILGILAGLIGSLNPNMQIEKANSAVYENTCTKECASVATSNSMDFCIQKCVKELKDNK